MHFLPKKFKSMTLPESAPQELSNEWSLLVDFNNRKYMGQFLCPALGDGSYHQSLKAL
jgi:hypothetical protein